MTDTVEIHELDDVWDQSTGDPNALFGQEDPAVQAGTYVIQPGERVPVSGTTSHDGPELSVILTGEIVLGTPDTDGPTEQTVSAGAFSVIPAGVEHYSKNDGNEPVRLVYNVVGEL